MSAETIQTPPVVAIRWDDATRGISLNVDMAQARNPLFVISLLDMARRVCEDQIKLSQLAQMQQAAQDQEIARKIMRSN